MDRKMSRAAGVGLEETDYPRVSQVAEPCQGGMRQPSKSVPEHEARTPQRSAAGCLFRNAK
jgi:hypothetical protein